MEASTIKPSKHCGNTVDVPSQTQKCKNRSATPKSGCKSPQNRAEKAGSLRNPPKHRGNRCYIPVARAANPTKIQKWCDGATPSSQTFQRFCMVASGSNIKNKHHTFRFQACEILGIDGATNYETGQWDVTPFWGVKFTKVGHLYAHFSTWQSHLLSLRCNLLVHGMATNCWAVGLPLSNHLTGKQRW